MRTTLTLDDEAFQAAQRDAQARDMKLGQAVSDLIRRGTSEPRRLKRKGETWVADLPADTPTLTAAHVRSLLEDFP